LKRALKSLTQCQLPDCYEGLVVVENGSRAGAEQLVEELPEYLNARYMHRSRGNKSYALNQALGTLSGGLAVFFDDDVRVFPDTLVAYADAAKTHGPGHFFGGVVEVEREGVLPDGLAHLFPYSVRGYDLVEDRMGDEYLGFNWAAFTGDLEMVGGFNTKLGPGVDTAGTVGDESELQERMLRAGCRGVDVHRAKVSHYVPAENTTISWLLRRRIQGGVRQGLESTISGGEFLFRMIGQTLISLGVAVKGAITLDREKLVFVLCNLFQRMGVVKGYVWQSPDRESKRALRSGDEQPTDRPSVNPGEG
jgi:glycosyltransferase involved in cell wall biosynthesis